MSRQTVLLSFLILFCTSVPGLADDWQGKNGSNSGKNALNGAALACGRQGQSVGFADIDGDGVDDKVVGAPYASSTSNTGAVLVYKGNADGGFSSSPYMLLAGDDNSGFSFVNLGDVDGDCKGDFAVGAVNGDGPDVSLSGSVVVYEGGRDWNYNEGHGKVIAKLSGEGPMDKFGLSISAGDLNGDGKNDLIAGAPFNTDDPAVYQGGAVYVYFAPDFIDGIVLHASPLNKGLGWSVSAGDINGDNIPDLCISASGKVLCYYGSQDFNPAIDSPDVAVKSASAGFGKALAVIGDLNGDGLGEIVVGAPNAVVNGQRDTGMVYVIGGGTGNRTVNANAPSSDLIARIDGAALFNRFGFSVSPAGDLDGDRKADFAVGAPMAGSGALTLGGRVYFFKGKDVDGASTLADSTVFEGVARDQGYGTSLAAAENGLLLIGAPRTDMDTGAVYSVDLATGQTVQ